MRGRRLPVVLPASGPVRFPDPGLYDAEGLCAIGGDLAPATLLAAYRSGIFPWYAEGYVPMWWSPDPRALLDPGHLHVSRSLRKRIRRGGFELTWDRCFPRVMRECGRQREQGTWIIPEMVEAYTALHRLGHVHSLEVWQAGELVGGTYGVQIGGLFAAESMFHRATDMSKVALVALVHTLFAAGIQVLDVQFATEHLQTLGAFTIPRSDYLRRIAVACETPVDLVGRAPILPSIDG
ncbi:MAG: leucyl/phenylalanyl-tRNA--protein transferase [Planctomycetes bacterium]|nr:leucyl/phenylalanyl-tRNA--protein transferase [Planctomycetota bacterium]